METKNLTERNSKQERFILSRLGGMHRHSLVWMSICLWFALALLAAGCSSSEGNELARLQSTADSSADSSAANSEVSSAEQETDSKSIEAKGSSAGKGLSEAQAQTERKLIYKANLTMEVESYDKAKQQINNIIHLARGYILSFEDQYSEYERAGVYVMKVPADGFQSLLEHINKLPNLRFQRSYSATDVTEEYVDLSARLKARRVVESRLLGYMEKAVTSSDLLKFSNELDKVQEEIERIVGRMRYLNNNVSMSTIELRLYETIKIDHTKAALTAPFGERIGSTLSSSIYALTELCKNIVLFIVAVLPFLIVIILLLLPVWWVVRIKRSRSESSHNLYAERNRRLAEQTIKTDDKQDQPLKQEAGSTSDCSNDNQLLDDNK
ncbi:DUF4349 domain-containing protein [Paenibacillus taiwanensis]|uniref:DUF4349 domain-containing protein n=1 Tax=Paenibacillus taiwanensis TaxID=401638 RepID=UPI0004016592|nr:DUF4349 domain-containing protein [Paenibacillus taiwanensis]